MKTDTKERIISYIKEHQKVRVYELILELGISAVAVHKQLRRLLGTGIISKLGRPPRVYYIINTGYHANALVVANEMKIKFERWYLYISSTGELLEGIEGFARWLADTNQKKQGIALAEKYIALRESVNGQFTSMGWLDATNKLRSTFAEVFVTKLLYQDFYAFPQFGKTKLGWLVLFAKQSQNRELIRRVAMMTRPIIERVIKQYAIDAVGFIPPTVPRNIQFMHDLNLFLKLALPRITLEKVFPTSLRVPQKSLPKLEARLENARATIFPRRDGGVYRNVLLIDDAVGSGATMNETARRLKEDGIVSGKITAFAIVGSMKGFDVISEI